MGFIAFVRILLLSVNSIIFWTQYAFLEPHLLKSLSPTNLRFFAKSLNSWRFDRLPLRIIQIRKKERIGSTGEDPLNLAYTFFLLVK